MTRSPRYDRPGSEDGLDGGDQRDGHDFKGWMLDRLSERGEIAIPPMITPRFERRSWTDLGANRMMSGRDLDVPAPTERGRGVTHGPQPARIGPVSLQARGQGAGQ